MNLEVLVKETVEQYYNMDEMQRAFIVKVIDTNPQWNKYDYMKALMLFNKAQEFGCAMSDWRIDDFVRIIDRNSSTINYWLKNVDSRYRENHGYLQHA